MATPESIHNIIEKEYLNIRLSHSTELERRKEEIYSTIPGFKDIDNQVITASMDYARKLFGIEKGSEKHKEMADAYHHELLDLRLKKKELLKAHGYDYDYLDQTYTCTECLDTGYIDGVKCQCYKVKETQLLYGECIISNMFAVNNFDNLSRDYYTDEDLVHFDKAVTTSKNFIKNFNSDYRNLLFCGKVGTGKSFLSCCIAKELIDKGVSVIYFSSSELFRTISDYNYSKDREGLNSLMQTLYGCDLLVIDDLGSEFVNDFVRNQLFNLINERILRQKSIIISTNLSLDGIKENYSERIMSRFYEYFEILKLTVFKDIRLQMKLEKVNRERNEI